MFRTFTHSTFKFDEGRKINVQHATDNDLSTLCDRGVTFEQKRPMQPTVLCMPCGIVLLNRETEKKEGVAK